MANSIKLTNVRLSFPSLFSREVFQGKEGKYAATFLLPKSDTKTRKRIDKAIAEAIQESGVKGKIAPDRMFIKDGDNAEYDGYADHWSIKASSNHRPQVFDRARHPVTESDELVYGGCYVNAVIDLWVQDNQYGKRVNANLMGVQFVSDGERFGSGGGDVTDQFDALEDDDDDDDEDDGDLL